MSTIFATNAEQLFCGNIGTIKCVDSVDMLSRQFFALCSSETNILLKIFLFLAVS